MICQHSKGPQRPSRPTLCFIHKGKKDEISEVLEKKNGAFNLLSHLSSPLLPLKSHSNTTYFLNFVFFWTRGYSTSGGGEKKRRRRKKNLANTKKKSKNIFTPYLLVFQIWGVQLAQHTFHGGRKVQGSRARTLCSTPSSTTTNSRL